MCRCNSSVAVELPHFQKPLSQLLTGTAAVTAPTGFGMGHGAHSSLPPLRGLTSTFSTAGCRTATLVSVCGDTETLHVHTNRSEPGAVGPSACFYLSLLFTAPLSAPTEFCIPETADQEFICEFLGSHSFCWARPLDWS